MYNPSGSEQEVTLADGRSFTLGRLTVAVLRKFKTWLAGEVGDPFADVERWLGRVSAEESARQLREAEGLRDQLRYFSFATPVAQKALASEEGLAKVFWLLLQARHPQATEEDGLAVALHLVEAGRVAAALREAQGLPEAGGGPGDGDGPAPAGGGTADAPVGWPEGNAAGARPPL